MRAQQCDASVANHFAGLLESILEHGDDCLFGDEVCDGVDVYAFEHVSDGLRHVNACCVHTNAPLAGRSGVQQRRLDGDGGIHNQRLVVAQLEYERLVRVDARQRKKVRAAHEEIAVELRHAHTAAGAHTYHGFPALRADQAVRQLLVELAAMQVRVVILV